MAVLTIDCQMPLNTIGVFVVTESCAFGACRASVFQCLWVVDQHRIQYGFLDAFSHLNMQCLLNLVKHSILTPLLVVPEYDRIRQQVLRQIFPIAPVLQLIEHTIENLSLRPHYYSTTLTLQGGIVLGKFRHKHRKHRHAKTPSATHKRPVTSLVDITSKGKVAVQTFKRAQILLLSEQGYKDQSIAERVGVSIATVECTRQKFVQQGLDAAITEKPRPGKPCKPDGKTEAFLTATACSDAPDRRATWIM